MAAKAKQPVVEEIADEEEDGEDVVQPQRGIFSRLFSRKLAIVAAACLVVLVGGGTAAYFMLAGKKEAKSAALAAKPVVFFDLPEVLVNLSTSNGDRTQY